MKICVYGLWHLGTVTAACLANRGFEVVGLDSNTETIDDLNCGKAPLYEPGLDELVSSNIEAGRLSFSQDLRSALSDSVAVFIAVGTPGRRGDGHADPDESRLRGEGFGRPR